MGESNQIVPEPQEITEAKRNPNGWVYRIRGQYGTNEQVPPEAIMGAWKVNERGEIIGHFIPNPKFKGDL